MTPEPAAPSPEWRNPPEALLLGFTRALRAAGVPVTQDRAQSYLAAVTQLDLGDPRATLLAGRATLCAGPDDLERHDRVFESWFLAREGLPRASSRQPEPIRSIPLDRDGDGGAGAERDDDVLRVAASEAEILRHRDLAELSAAEKALLARLFDTLTPRAPRRPAHRRTPHRRGEVDPRRTLRATLRHFGEPGRVAWRRRGSRPRRVVLLLDVSGSMSGYADALLRLAHRFAVSERGVEVFTVGTRLTHITRALRQRDAERAIVAAGQVVPDWSGGTRLGESLRFFLDRWGQRGMARGAVMVIVSDGWERGDAELLGAQMARLHRLAHRVVWVNPHRGRAGYAPVQAGIVASLPHIDDFLAGHSLATYLQLTEVVAHA